MSFSINTSDLSNGGVSDHGKLIQTQSHINRVNSEISYVHYLYMLELFRGPEVLEKISSGISQEQIESIAARKPPPEITLEEIKDKLDELHSFRNQLRSEERDLIEGLGGYEKIQKAKAHEAGFGPPFSF